MRVTLGRLKEIISEAWKPSEELTARMGKQKEIRERFEQRAETFLQGQLPEFETILSSLQEEAREIMGELEGYEEPWDEVDGYGALAKFADIDLWDLTADMRSNQPYPGEGEIEEINY
jgi:hypothetical protein